MAQCKSWGKIMNQKSCPAISILINGAGLAGLTMAQALMKFYPGCNFKIIEKATELRSTGASIALPGNATEGLKMLALLPKVLACAKQVKAIRYCQYDGALLSEASLIDDPILNQYPFVALQRYELLDILATGLKPAIQFATTIEKYQEVEGKTRVELSDGSRFLADLIVDASGVNSDLRFQVLGQDLREDLGITCWRFVVPIETNCPSYYLLSPNGGVGLLYPTSGGQSYVYLHKLESLDAYQKEIDQAMLLEFFSEFSPNLVHAIEMATAENIRASRITSIKAPIMAVKNIAFIGDAAAACSPQLQQGYASAVEDALSLAVLLQLEPTLEAALSRYVNMRLPRVSWIKNSSDEPLKKFSEEPGEASKQQLAEKIRQVGPLNALGWRHLFRQNFLSQLTNDIVF